MRRGEIWVVGIDPAEGHEQKGRRPVLVISPDAFNQVTKVPVVLPITSATKVNPKPCVMFIATSVL
jgi:mRNA-degrading endonuclease toxin of MazEF toxin-antitoxin module